VVLPVHGHRLEHNCIEGITVPSGILAGSAAFDLAFALGAHSNVASVVWGELPRMLPKYSCLTPKCKTKQPVLAGMLANRTTR
jgi:hypothetical protein